MARIEHRGRRVGLLVIQGAFALSIVGIWTWALTAWPAFDYRVVPSRLPTYGLAGLPASVIVWFLVRRVTGIPVATLIVGVAVVLGGLALGLSPPIPFGGQSGWCRSVFLNLGLHGDDREDCFDARASRADDVAIVFTFGLLVSAAGTTLVAQRARRDPERRRVERASVPASVR